ncbi:amidohydrolase family protein [Erythrobacter sp. NAP1]|uniref:amidohydrolase n=1 Tax=Erythrobacter sp. NAP1 TaxID=237727 RepID=UPI0000686B6C|nr:amidohydrolase [Erythrobacter sp. NAP1]EAQ30009.1 amidohydrolase family protein [Erythrobacter sp. NAP1]
MAQTRGKTDMMKHLMAGAAMAMALSMSATPALAEAHAEAGADELRAAVMEDMPGLFELYKDLHANPELSFQEFETAAKLAERARALGFEVTEGVGQTGVVAVMENGPGPVVMLRADMDGLPVIEQTGLPYASKRTAVPATGVETGVMHACGHDTHMAAWVGAAQLLAERKDDWSGTLVMILQPAEETGEGALAMLQDGLYERFPKPDYVLAFHDAAQAPAGFIGYSKGYALANVDSVDVVIPGIGGHGAYPHTTVDPVVIGANVVTRLQTLVSREISPLDPAVVTVGSFRAGSKHNIISDEARLQITVRSYTDEVRAALLEGIERIARGEAMAAGMPEDKLPSVTVQDPYTPSTYNTPEFTENVMAGLKERFGDRVRETPSVMGGEDFGQFYRADPETVESLIFWVGGVPMEQYLASERGEVELPSLHSPFWAPDAEVVIATATEALTAATLDLMPRSGG